MIVLRSALFLGLLSSGVALADDPVARIGGSFGYQRTDRNAWVFGPTLEIKLIPSLSFRGEGQLEFGNIDAPFGESNIFSGTGPHVNHVLFGPAYRPTYKALDLATGLGVGVSITHSVFAPDREFNFAPAAGFFVQAGKQAGPVELALQARLDVSPRTIEANEDETDTQTIAGRFVLSIEIPIYAASSQGTVASIR